MLCNENTCEAEEKQVVTPVDTTQCTPVCVVGGGGTNGINDIKAGTSNVTVGITNGTATISVEDNDTTYTAGEGIAISSENVISATGGDGFILRVPTLPNISVANANCVYITSSNSAYCLNYDLSAFIEIKLGINIGIDL